MKPIEIFPVLAAPGTRYVFALNVESQRVAVTTVEMSREEVMGQVPPELVEAHEPLTPAAFLELAQAYPVMSQMNAWAQYGIWAGEAGVAVEVFPVKKGERVMYVAALTHNEFPVVIARQLEKLFVLLAGLEHPPERVKIEAREFTVPEFLELARTHPALREMKNWEPLDQFQ